MERTIYQNLLKPVLFGLDAETAHYFSAALLKMAYAFTPVRASMENRLSDLKKDALATKIGGIHFPNPVGLAAGFDKNAVLVDEMPLLGFGFSEIGTVTPLPQIGNPRPRLFRIPEEKAILNRMGFNNDGVRKVAERLEKRKNTTTILGGNIGKNKQTPNELAHQDYLSCFEVLQDLVDYFTINLSSPNTPGLRQLLEKESLSIILEAVMNQNRKRTTQKPVFLKISPDLEHDQPTIIAAVCEEFGLTGIIASNTTIDRNRLKHPQRIAHLGSGGISGEPLGVPARDLLRELRSATDSLALMASGGIMNPADALRCFESGADLIQLYSGLVYYGPTLPTEILKDILK